MLQRLISLIERFFASLMAMDGRVDALEEGQRNLMSANEEILNDIAEIKQDVVDRDAKTKEALGRLEAKIDELGTNGVDVTAVKAALADVKTTFDADQDAIVNEANTKVPPPAPAPAEPPAQTEG